MKGRVLSDDTKQKIRESKMGDKNPMKKEENKNKLRGRKPTEESKEKNRQGSHRQETYKRTQK